MKTVLFACVHNAGRSQMAAALFNEFADSSKARAISAGTDPGAHVHPEVITAMREIGIEFTGASTTKLTSELAQQAQVLDHGMRRSMSRRSWGKTRRLAARGSQRKADRKSS
jgi:arsenate reductase